MLDMQMFMGMNTNHINEFKRLIAMCAECHRRVHPVINTCLNNITASSDAVDPDKVQLCGWNLRGH